MRSVRARPIAYVAIVAVLLVLLAQNAMGEDLTGTGPDFAMSPSDQWVEIQPGQYDWYVFKYEYKEKNGPMEVKLYSEPAEAAVLTLRNLDQAKLWREDGKHEHFGCCTPVERDANKDGKGDYALWAAHMRATGTYYMVVEHAKNVSGPAQYRIEVKGDGYSFTDAPLPVVAPPEEAAVVEPVILAGTGPDVAMALPTEPATINAGEYQWYYFDYTRDSKTKDEDLRPVEIKVFSEPAGVAKITIRDGEDAAAWRQDGTHQSFGACTCSGIDKDKNGVDDYGLWCGKLYASGRYYVVVEHARNNAAPATYRIEVKGL
jgi:hypothetical protein